MENRTCSSGSGKIMPPEQNRNNVAKRRTKIKQKI
ncbi:hypothetical protein PMLGA01_140017800 [Plasmodium malariae]|uniref:Uncharacterized protein n=1 Tax=Plasmodium malariae TaxID=5858 RepID=A0A1C3L298_PLAMA|nr:hypothetical protein PMLGA01_140017800 [Plasmodium malariae]